MWNKIFDPVVQVKVKHNHSEELLDINSFEKFIAKRADRAFAL